MARKKGAQKKGESPNTLTKATMEVDPESPAPGPDFAPVPDLIPFDPVEEKQPRRRRLWRKRHRRDRQRLHQTVTRPTRAISLGPLTSLASL
jgi:hypothetical protein